MRKITLFAMLAMIAIGMPALSIELPSDATPLFSGSSTAYSSSINFNMLLESYGLKLPAGKVSSVPASYATISGDTINFNKESIAYTPTQYHSILTAYGLELSPMAVTEKLGSISSYAKVQTDEIVFGKKSVAYGGDEWTAILSAYSLPVVATPAPIAAVPIAKPMPGDRDGDGVSDDKDACPNTPKGVAVGERGCWALSNGLLFDFDSSTINKESYKILDYTKEAFDAYPNMKVQIDGHTDSTGPENYNQLLSEKRAQAIMNYLIKSVGIEASRLKAVGHGEAKPAFSNDTKSSRAKNRRVEFTPLT